MDPDEAIDLAHDFDCDGTIDFSEKVMAAGVGPGYVLIVRMPGQPDRVGEAARAFLSRLTPYLKLLQRRALDAVTKMEDATPGEIAAGERIARAQLEKEGR